MKLLIYIILFVILLVYINNHSKKLTKEEFSNGLFDNINTYQAVNPYEIIDKNVLKPMPVSDSSDYVVAFNENPANTLDSNNWILSNSDYSDIFNGSDMGSSQIIKTLGLPRPKVFLDKAMQKITNKSSNEKTIEEDSQPRIPISEKIIGEQKQTKPKIPIGEKHMGKPNERPVAEVHKRNILAETIPEEKSTIQASLYPLEIKNSGLTYNLLGYVYNTAYRQYYLIYEAINKQINPNLVLREKLDNMDVQTYNYALVKIEKSKPVIKYIFGPRNKININDVVYLSQGPLQIGPLIVDNI